MHVVHLSWEHPPRLFGGLGRHVGSLVPALGDVADLDVTVVTPALAAGVAEPPAPRVTVRRAARRPALPPAHWVAEVLDANLAMADVVADLSPAADLLHVHDWMAGQALRSLHALDVPVVATIHATERGRHMGHVPDGVSTWVDAQEKALVARADHVVVCSRWMAGRVVADLGVDPATVTVIPNAVDAASWAVPAQRRPDLVVFAGRIEHEKGVHVLLDAVQQLDADLVVAGDGTMRRRLEQRVGSPRTDFVGRLDRTALARLLAAATVVAVPSLYEPFGLVALEAMAAGAPVVASDVGGLAELVDGAGVLVPPDDVAALRDAVASLLADDAARARLAAQGRRRARRTSWAASASTHAAVYRSLAGSAVRPEKA